MRFFVLNLLNFWFFRMPYPVAAMQNTASIMIGEKGADLIKEDHGWI